ncbi:MAG: hypothetical protein K1Y01_16370 [Vicinamibacteria bacterium]|nr:hypothetical protein [Vicinamibacteria bacterium]
MTALASFLAVLYAVLLPIGRSGLPLNAQWGDLLLVPLAIAVAMATKGGTRRWLSGEDWPLALYLLATLTAAAVSVEPAAGFKHLAKQLSVALAFLVFRRAAPDAELTRRVQIAFAAAMAAVVVAAMAVVLLRFPAALSPSSFGEAQVLPLFGRVRRLRGLFEAPEMLGNALLLAFVLTLGLREAADGKPKRGWTALAILLAAGEFFTYSHSVAGFGAAAAMFLQPRLPSRGARILTALGALAVVFVVNAASVIDPRPPARGTHYEAGDVAFEAFGLRVEGRLMSYAALKKVAWSGFLEHPLLGVGPGRFPEETQRAYREGHLPARYRSVPPHCDLLGRLAESGALGAASLVGLWAAWIRSLRAGLWAGTPLQRAAAAAVSGLLVNSVNADVMNFRFLWLAVAWMSAVPGHPPGEARPEALP